MKALIDILQKKKNVFHNNGTDEKSVLSAEAALGLKFSDDYREYLLNFGILSYEGHEYTGICNSTRLNVVDATKREKEENNNLTDDTYLLEWVGVENMTIWQRSDGEVFEVPYKGKPKKIYDSLIAYLEKNN